MLGRCIKNYFIYPPIFAVILTVALWPYYSEGTLILGGEGNFFLDFSKSLETLAYQWVSRFGLGYPNMAPGGNAANTLLLSKIEYATKSKETVNFCLIFLLYYLPFLGMYLATLEITKKSSFSFLIALFYLVNPYTLTFLSSLNQWNATAIAAMPFLLWITYRYYQDNIRLFMYYGIVSALFSFAYSNPPLSAIINISSLFVVYLISYHHNGKLAPMEFIGKYSLVLFSFVLFNSWWLLNLFNIVDDALKIYSVPFATAWLEQTVAYATAPIAKSLSLTHITPAAEWDFLGAHYHSFPAQIITLLPLILVTYIIFFINDKSHAKFNLHLFAVVLLMIFLTKGSGRPFGEVYVFLFKNIPFFNIFKSPIEKFGLLYIVFFTMLILFVFHSIKEHPFYKKILTLFSTYLLFCTIPIFTGNIIPDQRIYVDGIASRIYKDEPEYQNLRNFYKNKKF